jgi:hypothetical protein
VRSVRSARALGARARERARAQQPRRTSVLDQRRTPTRSASSPSACRTCSIRSRP